MHQMTQGPGTGPGARLAGVWGGRVAGAGTFVEDFPELGLAAGSGGGGSGWGGSTWSRPAAAPAAPAATSSTPGASLRKVGGCAGMRADGGGLVSQLDVVDRRVLEGG